MSDTPSAPPASRGVSRRLIGGLTAGAVLVASGGLAFADSIYASAATVSAAPGATATFKVALRPEGSGVGTSADPTGCNATAATTTNPANPANPVTISFITSNSSVASAPTAVTVTGCDNPLTEALENAVDISVRVSAGAASGASATLTLSGTGGRTVVSNGSNNGNQQLLTTQVIVNVDGKQDQAPLSVTSPTAGTFGQTYPITTSGGSGSGAVTYAVTGTACAASGASSVAITSGTGTCSITATKAADTAYNAATSAPLSVTVSKAAQPTLSVASPTAGTFQDRLDLVHAGGAGTGALTFAASGGACQVAADGKLEIVSGSGDCSVTASRSSDNNYLSATSVARTVALSKKAQAPLSVTSAGTGTFGDVIVLTSEGGSGTGGTTYAATGDACSIPTTGTDAGKLTITKGTGTCSVTATKAADGNYAAVSSPPQSITVGRKAQDGLAVVAASTGKFGDVLPLDVTGGSSSAPVAYSAGDSTACSITADNRLRITSGTGTCAVTASKAADGNYTAVSSQPHPVFATKAPATVTLTGLAPTYNGSAHAAGATTLPAGLNGVSFTYDAETVAPRAAGSYTVVATLDHPDYAGSRAGTMTIARKQVTGSFTAQPKTYDGSDTASVIPAAISGAVPGDQVILVVSNAQFSSPAAGPNKAVTGALRLDGAAATNYEAQRRHRLRHGDDRQEGPDRQLHRQRQGLRPQRHGYRQDAVAA